jgi:hypothetical protein
MRGTLPQKNCRDKRLLLTAYKRRFIVGSDLESLMSSSIYLDLPRRDLMDMSQKQRKLVEELELEARDLMRRLERVQHRLGLATQKLDWYSQAMTKGAVR